MSRFHPKNLVGYLTSNPARNFLIFSQLLNGVMGVVMGKLIAVLFPPEEFGVYNIQYATYFFFFTIFMNPYLQFMKMFTGGKLEKEGHRYVMQILAVLLLICSVGLAVLFKFNYAVSNPVLILLLLMLPINVLYNLITDYFNIKGKLTVYSWATIFKSLGSTIFLVLVWSSFITWKNSVFVLWFVQIIGYLATVLFFIKFYPWIFNRKETQSFKEFFKEYQKYTLPLVFLAFWSWAISYSDRYIIEYFMDTKYVGIYNANLGLGSKVFLLLSPIFVAMVTPIVFNSEEKMAVKKMVTKKYVILYSLTAIALLIVLFFLTNFIGKIFLSELYKDGFYLIFWTALGYFLITLVSIPELLFYAESKTKAILISNIIAAVSNILLNLILIPIFGLQGAAISLIVSAILKCAYSAFVFTKLS